MRDAIRFAGRLSAELGGLGLDRLARRTDRVPRSLRDIDAAWLTEALSGRFPGARVKRIRALSENTGTTARRRIAIDYENGARPDAAPSTVFVKVPPPRLAERLFGRMFNLGPNEVAFYRDARPALPIRAPGCFAAETVRSGAYALVLEDLEGENVALKSIEDPVSLEEAEAVVASLAKLHARFWSAPRFAWARTPTANPNEAVERFICERAHQPTLRRFSALLPNEVREGVHRIHAERRLLERYWGDGPLTLVHGDSHVGNMYFVAGEAGFFDWQVTQYAHGVRDLAYFLVLSVDTELRRAHERALFDDYCRRLRHLGVPADETKADPMWERYRSFSLYAYIAASVTATMSDLQPAQVAELGLARAATAVADLEALALLDHIA